MSSPHPASAVHALILRFLEHVADRTHAEAARTIGVDPASIQNWREGRLPKQRVAASTRAALEGYLLRAEGPTGSAAALEHLDRAEAALDAAREAIRASTVAGSRRAAAEAGERAARRAAARRGRRSGGASGGA